MDWQAAAERAFGSALQHPEAYQRTASLGRCAPDRRLREAGPGPAALVAAWAAPRALLDGVQAADARLDYHGSEPRARGRRGIRDALPRGRRRDRAAQRLHGSLPTVPREAGSCSRSRAPRDGDPFVPYRRVEAEPATGRALLVTTRPDDTFTGCVHEVVSGLLDLPPAGCVGTRTTVEGSATAVPDETSREAAASALKRHSTD